MERTNPLVRTDFAAATPNSDACAACFVFTLVGAFTPFLLAGNFGLASFIGGAVGLILGLILAYD
ncbi:MAG: hypothetical protein QM770_22350 [Tepidisphaeraceae bacterium]